MTAPLRPVPPLAPQFLEPGQNSRLRDTRPRTWQVEVELDADYGDITTLISRLEDVGLGPVEYRGDYASWLPPGGEVTFRPSPEYAE